MARDVNAFMRQRCASAVTQISYGSDIEPGAIDRILGLWVFCMVGMRGNGAGEVTSGTGAGPQIGLCLPASRIPGSMCKPREGISEQCLGSRSPYSAWRATGGGYSSAWSSSSGDMLDRVPAIGGLSEDRYVKSTDFLASSFWLLPAA